MYLDIQAKKQRKVYSGNVSDFYERLLNQTDADERKIAKDIALSLEIFVKGSLNIFNNQTNVDMDNKIYCLWNKRFRAGSCSGIICLL
ncbi:MAG: hypothetical protein ACLUEN_00240 [Coprococcus sp.]